MSISFKNLPDSLKAVVPAQLVEEEPELLIFDHATIERAANVSPDAAGNVRLLGAYTRLLGAEGTEVSVKDLPHYLHQLAEDIAGGAETISGEAVMTRLKRPESIPIALRGNAAEIAEILHEQMGREAFDGGTLKEGFGLERANESVLSRWFAASVAEVRVGASGEPVQGPGAKRFVSMTKEAMLNFGGGLILRAFYDNAIHDLERDPGLTAPAQEILGNFRVLTQPGRTTHARTEHGALVRLDAAERRKLELSFLSQVQHQAVSSVINRQKARVAEAREQLLEKIKPWNYNELDLNQLIAYLSLYARVTIQFHPDKQLKGGQRCIESFLDNPIYKNQFETKISSGALAPSSGSCRDGWEKRIFDGAYHARDLIPEERPKYGGLSPLNHPAGNGGNHYGRCFFELRQDIKFRTTFTPKNSSGAQADEVSHIDVIEILLAQISKSDPDYLQKMFQVAKGEKISFDKRFGYSYIEAQIHGDVYLPRDVDFLVIEKSYLGTPYEEQLLSLAESIGATPKYTDQKKFYLPDALPSEKKE